MAASTEGTGQLILAAVAAGARRVVVGVGGSATTDGGLGAVEVLAGRTRGVEVVVACDVRSTFVEAATVFASQKGASAAQVGLLTRRLERLAQIYRDRYGVDVTEMEGAGAAGGLAGGLAAATGAQLVSGFEVAAEANGLFERIEEADLVVTAEGFVDDESFNGKVVGGVVEAARSAGSEVLIVAGDLLAEVAAPAVSLVERYGEDRARSDTAACVEEIVFQHLEAR
jgi:glycerate kinase